MTFCLLFSITVFKNTFIVELKQSMSFLTRPTRNSGKSYIHPERFRVGYDKSIMEANVEK